MHFEKKDDILMELTKTAENKTENDAWLSLVERYVRDVEVAGSNPVASIPWQGRVEKSGKIFGFFFILYRKASEKIKKQKQKLRNKMAIRGEKKMKRNMAEKLTASILAAVLTFGMMAPQTAMTAEAAAKSTLEKDVQKLVKKSKAKKEKTQKKKLKKLFQYVEKNYGYARAIGFKNSRGWEKTFTAEMIKNKKGSCYHFAALYAFLAKESGVEARICLGRTNGFNKARWQDHAWCEVKVGKKWYICDPNMDKFAANSKGKYFMKTVSSMKSTFKKSKTIKVNF